MRARVTPRPILDTPNRFTVDTPGVGVTRWRLPFPTHMLGLLDAMASVESVKGHSGIARAYDLGGAAIGLCWDSPTHDLDAINGGDLVAYGRAVLDELADVGWSMDAVGVVMPALFGRFRAAVIPASEVAGRAGFSDRPPEGTS